MKILIFKGKSTADMTDEEKKEAAAWYGKRVTDVDFPNPSKENNKTNEKIKDEE